MVWSTIFVKCCRSNRNNEVGWVPEGTSEQLGEGRRELSEEPLGVRSRKRIVADLGTVHITASTKLKRAFFFSLYRVHVCLLYFISNLKTKTKCFFSEFSVFRKCVWYSVPNPGFIRCFCVLDKFRIYVEKVNI